MADNTSKEMFDQFCELSPEGAALVRRMLVSGIDAGIARFLHFLDDNEVEVWFRDRAGNRHDVRALSDGLVGELYSDDGWIAKFSQFRDHIDPAQ